MSGGRWIRIEIDRSPRQDTAHRADDGHLAASADHFQVEHGDCVVERADRIPDPVPGVDYQSLITDPGDGVVTRSSLMGRGPRGQSSDIAPLENSHSVFLCEDHQLLTSNLSFQDNLLYTLLHHRED